MTTLNSRRTIDKPVVIAWTVAVAVWIGVAIEFAVLVAL